MRSTWILVLLPQSVAPDDLTLSGTSSQTLAEATAETASLAGTSSLTMLEDITGTSTADTLTFSQTSVLSMIEALAETPSLSQTVTEDGTIADPGDTYSVSQTMQLIVLDNDIDNILVLQTNVPETTDVTNASEIDARRLSQELALTLVEVIANNIETVTLSQQNIVSILEAFDELLVSHTNTVSIDDVVPLTIDTLTLAAQNVVALSEDAEVAQLIATNVVQLLEGAEVVQLSQTNVPSLTDLIVDNLMLAQINGMGLTERIVAAPVPQPATQDGVETSRVVIPYAPVTVALDGDLAETSTRVVLSGSVSSLPQANFVLEIEDETLFVMTRFGNECVVVRGWSMTNTAPHDDGETVTWPTHYDLALSSSVVGEVDDWLTFFDCTQAYLDGARYAFHADSVRSVGRIDPGDPNKIDGPQPWRASPFAGLGDAVPAGVCQPARLVSPMAVGDRCVVRYINNVAPTGVFELGPRAVMFMLWTTADAFARYDGSGNPDTSNPNANIYDGKATLNTTYEDSASLVTATEIGFDRIWTIPTSEGGFNKAGINYGLLVLRHGTSPVPSFASSWQSGDWVDMGFDDPDAMFMQVVYKYHQVPASEDIDGPLATWSSPGFRTATAFAMFTIRSVTTPLGTVHAVPGTGPGSPGGGVGGTGGGISRPPIPVSEPDDASHHVLIVHKA